MAAALAWFVAAISPSPPAIDPVSWTGLLVSAQQVFIGLSMGFMLQLVFAVLTVAGESIAMSMGLGFAMMVDPQNGAQVPVVAQYFLIMAMLLFLALGGHIAFLEMVLTSFDHLPVAVHGFDRDMAWLIVTYGSELFVGALLVALPVVTSILLVNMAFGVVTRAAPQLNIFAVGFPITLMLGLFLLMVNWPNQVTRIESLLLDSLEQIGRVIGR